MVGHAGQRVVPPFYTGNNLNKGGVASDLQEDFAMNKERGVLLAVVVCTSGMVFTLASGKDAPAMGSQHTLTTGTAPQARTGSPPAVHHILIEVSDFGKAIQFYQGGLGFAVMSNDGGFATLKGKTVDIYLSVGHHAWEKARSPAQQPGQGMYPHVLTDDVPALVAKLKAAGYRIVDEPRTYSWGAEAFAADPDGYVWAIVSMHE